MASNFWSGSPVIEWGEWRCLSNGQWHREGQDLSGNWYEDNQDEDPRDSRIPRHSPSVAEFTHQFDSLTISSAYQGQGMNYGGYDEEPTGQQTQNTFASSRYTRSSEPDPRRHKGKGKHTEKTEQSESSHRVQDKGKSSRYKGDTKGHGKSIRSRRTEAKGDDKNMEQQTTLGPKQDQVAGAKDSSRSSIGHTSARRPVGIVAEPERSSTADEPRDFASNKEDSPEELTSKFDALIISDNLKVEASPNLKVAEADAIENEALSHSLHSPVSSISLTDAFSGTSARESHLEISQRQAFIQQLIADVEFILQTRTQARSAVTRGQAPASSNQTRSNTTSSRTENEVTQSASSPRRSTPQKKRKLSNQQSDGENSDDGEHTQDQTPKSKDTEEKLFACPFVKHGSSRCGPNTCSRTKGWLTVRRVKEHVYRRHLQRAQCSRCQTKFGDDEALKVHLRLEVPCKLTEGTTLEGITLAQKEDIRSRTGLQRMTEEEVWRKMYKIIFPEVGEDQIPSPYYNREDSCGCSTNASLEESLVQQLPEQLANDLEEELNASGGKINKSQLAQLVTERLNRVLNAYNKKRAGVVSEASIRDAHSRSNQEAEASSSASATRIDFAAPKNWSQDMHWPNGPQAPSLQQIAGKPDGMIEASQKEAWGHPQPSKTNINPDELMADLESDIHDSVGEAKWDDDLWQLISDPVPDLEPDIPTRDTLLGGSGNTQQYTRDRKLTLESGYGSLPDWDWDGMSYQANDVLDTTTQDPLPQSSKQAQASTAEALLNMEMNRPEYNHKFSGLEMLLDISVQESQLSTTPWANPSGPRANHLEAGANLQQTTDLEEHTTVSGNGGLEGFQNPQPWP